MASSSTGSSLSSTAEASTIGSGSNESGGASASETAGGAAAGHTISEINQQSIADEAARQQLAADRARQDAEAQERVRAEQERIRQQATADALARRRTEEREEKEESERQHLLAEADRERVRRAHEAEDRRQQDVRQAASLVDEQRRALLAVQQPPPPPSQQSMPHTQLASPVQGIGGSQGPVTSILDRGVFGAAAQHGTRSQVQRGATLESIMEQTPIRGAAATPNTAFNQSMATPDQFQTAQHQQQRAVVDPSPFAHPIVALTQGVQSSPQQSIATTQVQAPSQEAFDTYVSGTTHEQRQMMMQALQQAGQQAEQRSVGAFAADAVPSNMQQQGGSAGAGTSAGNAGEQAANAATSSTATTSNQQPASGGAAGQVGPGFDASTNYMSHGTPPSYVGGYGSYGGMPQGGRLGGNPYALGGLGNPYFGGVDPMTSLYGATANPFLGYPMPGFGQFAQQLMPSMGVPSLAGYGLGTGFSAYPQSNAPVLQQPSFTAPQQQQAQQAPQQQQQVPQQPAAAPPLAQPAQQATMAAAAPQQQMRQPQASSQAQQASGAQHPVQAGTTPQRVPVLSKIMVPPSAQRSATPHQGPVSLLYEEGPVRALPLALQQQIVEEAGPLPTVDPKELAMSLKLFQAIPSSRKGSLPTLTLEASRTQTGIQAWMSQFVAGMGTLGVAGLLYYPLFALVPFRSASNFLINTVNATLEDLIDYAPPAERAVQITSNHRHAIDFVWQSIKGAVEGTLVAHELQRINLHDIARAWARIGVHAANSAHEITDKMMDFHRMKQARGEPTEAFVRRIEQAILQLQAVGTRFPDLTATTVLVHGLINDTERTAAAITLSQGGTFDNIRSELRVLASVSGRGGHAGGYSASATLEPSKAPGNAKKGKAAGLTCNYCQKPNHTEKQCRAKIRDQKTGKTGTTKPNQKGPQGGCSQDRKSNKECGWCCNKGHQEKDCRKKKQGYDRYERSEDGRYQRVLGSGTGITQATTSKQRDGGSKPQRYGSAPRVNANAADAEQEPSSAGVVVVIDDQDDASAYYAQVKELDEGSSQQEVTAAGNTVQAMTANAEDNASMYYAILDTGASHHLIQDASMLTQLTPSGLTISMAGGKSLQQPLIGKGELRLAPECRGQHRALHIENALTHPGLNKTLISAHQLLLTIPNSRLVISQDSARWVDAAGTLLLEAPSRKGLYQLKLMGSANARHARAHASEADDLQERKEIEVSSASEHVDEIESVAQQQQRGRHNQGSVSQLEPQVGSTRQQQIAFRLHQRAGHISGGKLAQLLASGAVQVDAALKSLRLNDVRNATAIKECAACLAGKMSLKPFPSRYGIGRRGRTGELIYADTIGPITPLSIRGERYILHILDDFSSYSEIYMLEEKSEAAAHVERFLRQFFSRHRRHPAQLRTDGGGEFVNQQVDSYCEHAGIQHNTAPPYEHPTMGIIERKHRVIEDCITAMLAGAVNAPQTLWCYAAQHAVDTLNSTLLHDDDTLTAIQLWEGKRSPVDISRFFVFGSSVWVHKSEAGMRQRGKFEPRADRAIYLGRSTGRACNVLLIDGPVREARTQHVKVLENNFEHVQAYVDSLPPEERDELARTDLQFMADEEERRDLQRALRASQEESSSSSSSSPVPHFNARFDESLEEISESDEALPHVVRREKAKEKKEPKQQRGQASTSQDAPSSFDIFHPTRREAGKRTVKPVMHYGKPSAADYQLSQAFGRSAKAGAAIASESDDSNPQRKPTTSRGKYRLGGTAQGLLEGEIEAYRAYFKQPAAETNAERLERERQREQALKQITELSRMPIDQRRKMIKGELVTPSQRCVANNKDGKQCRSLTCNGAHCWRHMRQVLGVKIGKSTIPGAGRGLFTARDFKKGEKIALYTGDVIEGDVDDANESAYIFASKNNINIDAARRNTATGRMINAPRGTNRGTNVEFKINPRTAEVTIKATRNLRKGEEVLVGYGPQYWRKVADRERTRREVDERRARIRADRDRASAAARAAKSAQANGFTAKALAQLSSTPTASATGTAKAGGSGKQVAADAEHSKSRTEPLNYNEIFGRPDEAKWLASIEREKDSLEKLKVYEILPPGTKLPQGATLLGTKWVFTIKGGGLTETEKSRIVALGNKQRPGSYDPFGLYAPTLQITTLRTLMAIATLLDFELDSADVTTAYLHAGLDEEIFIRSPKGFGHLAGTILKLNRALYGLRQAGACWNKTFSKAIVNLGFTRHINEDSCLYTMRTATGRILILGLYVDDIIYCYHRNDRKHMDSLRTSLRTQFLIKELGPIKRMIGIDFHRDRAAGTSTLTQASYIRGMLKQYGFSQVRATTTPEVTTRVALIQADQRRAAAAAVSAAASNGRRSASILDHKDRDDSVHPQLTLENYASAVGAVGWVATMTRPDIAHAYSIAASTVSNPTPSCLVHLTRLMRYLATTSEVGIIYYASPPHATQRQLSVFSDATWGSEPDGKSFTGIVAKLACGAIAWQARKQKSVAKSTSEAEYIAASDAGRQLYLLRRLLSHVGLPQKGPTPLLCDNTAAKSFIVEEGNSSMRKHINVCYHHIRELYEQGILTPIYISTSLQQADLLTKPLGQPAFSYLSNLVLGHSPQDKLSPY